MQLFTRRTLSLALSSKVFAGFLFAKFSFCGSGEGMPQPQGIPSHPISVTDFSKPLEGLPVSSSIPTEVPQEQAKLFHELLSALEKNHLPYAVSGAFALRQHTGICRVTKDLDLFMTASTVCDALPILRESGFECEVVDPVWLSKARKGDFFVDLITGMSNGLLMVEDSWIERASPAVVQGVNTRVLAPEELVASKVFVARRERFDGADIAHVIYGTYPSFDWDRAMELMASNWEMLLWSLLLFRYVYPAQTHFVPAKVWRELLGRLQREIAEPNPQAKFRGSLVDTNMFAIDVEEWGLANLLEEKRNNRLQSLEAVDKNAILTCATVDAPSH
jgi:hypothetical protein